MTPLSYSCEKKKKAFQVHKALIYRKLADLLGPLFAYSSLFICCWILALLNLFYFSVN